MIWACAASNLAALELRRARPRRAETLFRRALAIDCAHLDADHSRIALCRSNLAALLLERGRVDEAESLCRQALAVFRRQLGMRHPTTAVGLDNLAAILRQRRRPVQADAAAVVSGEELPVRAGRLLAD